MNIKDIPFLLPNFNQLTYLRNLINQIQFYYPENPIYVLDNGSDYLPLDLWYSTGVVNVIKFNENDFVKNLTNFLAHGGNQFPYYIVSDPDLSITPTTPPNF